MSICGLRVLASAVPAAFCVAAAAQTGPVNISSTFNSGSGPWTAQLTRTLGAGDYLIEYRGRADGPEYLFDAWNCSNQGNCWTNEFFIQTSGSTNFYGVQWAANDPRGPWRIYPSAALALTGAKAAIPSIPLHLSQAGTVGFGIGDWPYADNVGGISLRLLPAVPEPASWALLCGGLLSLTLLHRHRKARLRLGLPTAGHARRDA